MQSTDDVQNRGVFTLQTHILLYGEWSRLGWYVSTNPEEEEAVEPDQGLHNFSQAVYACD